MGLRPANPQIAPLPPLHPNTNRAQDSLGRPLLGGSSQIKVVREEQIERRLDGQIRAPPRATRAVQICRELALKMGRGGEMMCGLSQ